jgi:hypothetical protein
MAMNVTLELITLVSLVIAVLMSVVSWRIVRGERARSAARVAALADDIRSEPDDDLPLGADAMPMFESADATRGQSRVALAATILLVAGAFVSATIVLGVWTPGGAADGSASNAAEGRAASTRAPVPLELVALGHERDADGLIVRGILRNPSNGAEVDALTAVVLLFNRDGGFIASGRAAVEAAALLPGGETGFVVTIPGAADVARYRVSFRTEEHVVPHVDQRGYTGAQGAGLRAQARLGLEP